MTRGFKLNLPIAATSERRLRVITEPSTFWFILSRVTQVEACGRVSSLGFATAMPLILVGQGGVWGLGSNGTENRVKDRGLMGF